jgi:hypothetical protein
MLGSGQVAGCMTSTSGDTALSDAILVSGGNSQTDVLVTTNRAFFMCASLAQRGVVSKMAWFNGSALISGNLDAGIYDMNGNKIVSTGAVALSGTNVLQLGSVTPTQLEPDNYVLAFATSSNPELRSYFGANQAQLVQACGIGMLDSSYPLPSTVSFSSLAATANAPYVAAVMSSVF